jgi:hypothetical protein
MRNGDGEKALSASWLGSRLGIGPTRVDIMRRGGELYGVRAPGTQEYRYPSWQFDRELAVRPIVRRMIAVAREHGLSETRLDEVLEMRVGMGPGKRVVDLAREGNEDALLRAIRAAGSARAA